METAIANAKKLGYLVSDSSVTGPDGYSFKLAKRPQNRRETFAAVNFVVQDPHKTTEWYVATLGMERQLYPRGGGVNVYFPADKSEGVVFNFRAGVPVVPTPHDGRNAFSLPAAQVRRIYATLARMSPERIVHELQEISPYILCTSICRSLSK